MKFQNRIVRWSKFHDGCECHIDYPRMDHNGSLMEDSTTWNLMYAYDTLIFALTRVSFKPGDEVRIIFGLERDEEREWNRASVVAELFGRDEA